MEDIVNVTYENGFALVEVDDRIPLWKVFSRLTDVVEADKDTLTRHDVVLLTGTRTISGGDIGRLYQQVTSKFGLEVVRVFSAATDLDVSADIPVRIEPLTRMKAFLSRSELFESRATMFIKRMVRSGQTIDYEGHVVIYGDVNPGSMVRATGNISVFGRLLGSVWAGCGGDESAFVTASQMQPIQVRIAAIGAPGRDLVRDDVGFGPSVVQMDGNHLRHISLDEFIRS